MLSNLTLSPYICASAFVLRAPKSFSPYPCFYLARHIASKKPARLAVGDFWLTILFTALGYFVYGGVDGALAVLVLCMLYSLAGLASLAPFIGFITQALLMYYFVNPFVFGLTHIAPTWLTDLAFWVYLVMGAVITVFTTAWLIATLKERWY